MTDRPWYWKARVILALCVASWLFVVLAALGAATLLGG